MGGKRVAGRFDRACEELSKSDVQKKLFKLACKRSSSIAEAQDLYQAALTLAFDPHGRPWDDEGPMSFVQHVGSIINGDAVNAFRRRARRNDDANESVDPGNEPPDSRPNPDEALEARHEHERLARLGKALATALTDDPIAASIYDAVLDGVTSHAEHAVRAGCALDQVRLAYDRMKYQFRHLLEREGERHGEDRRPTAFGRAPMRGRTAVRARASGRGEESPS